jgi:hypothetical protein
MAIYRIRIDRAETPEDDWNEFWQESTVILVSTQYTLIPDLTSWLVEEIDPGADVIYHQKWVDEEIKKGG